MRTELYAANLTQQAIASSGTTINFGSTIRRTGKCIRVENGNVEVEGLGYYNINTNITMSSTANGTATVTLYKDDIAIPGATATVTIPASSSASVSIPAVIKKFCNCTPTEITAKVTGIGGSISNAAIMVERI